MTRLFAVFLLVSLVLTACNLYLNSTPEDPSGAQTAVAQTVAAQMTLAALTTTPPPPVVNTPTFTQTNPPPAPAGTCDQAQFVSETVPDNTVFLPNASFTKTWRLRNVGTCTWTSSYALVFDHGDQLGAPLAVPLAGAVAPGQEVDLPVNLQAPAAPGTYIGYWRLRNTSGVLFYTNSSTTFTVQIVVNPPTPTSTGSLYIPGPIITILLPATSQELSQVNINNGATGYTVAACPSGSVLVSGGYATAGSLSYAYSQYMDGNGWRVYAKNMTGGVMTLNAYATCLTNLSATSSSVTASVNVVYGNIGNASVTCPSGSVVTGGGYISHPDDLWVYNSSMSGNGWQVYARNIGITNRSLTVYAVCLAGTAGVTNQVGNSVTVSHGGTNSTSATCPSNSWVTGGGFALQDDLDVYNETTPGSATNAWSVYARNYSSSIDRLMNVYAICLSFP